MRHKVKTAKLGRAPAHRKATVAAMVRALIKQRRVKTTLAKAKAARISAEKMVTMARKGTLAARRNIASVLSDGPHMKALFDEIVPICQGRSGGYTRIVKLGRRSSDSSEMAILEWVTSPKASEGAEAAAPKA
jgi:large subunit ribosomal protein L17